MDGIEAFEIQPGAAEQEHELETLADILQHLVARDEERPARWLAPAFDRDVALIRTRVAAIATRGRLAGLLGPGAEAATQPEAGRLARASRRLAADPVTVALAIRWLEIRDGHRLPTWTEILRRRRLGKAHILGTTPEAASWFG